MLTEVLRATWKSRLARVGLVLLTVLLAAAAFAPLLAPMDPQRCLLSAELSGMSSTYLLGADPSGCGQLPYVVKGGGPVALDRVLLARRR